VVAVVGELPEIELKKSKPIIKDSEYQASALFCNQWGALEGFHLFVFTCFY
jgi:hypothetical protein